jgi:hypothetical protein
VIPFLLSLYSSIHVVWYINAKLLFLFNGAVLNHWKAFNTRFATFKGRAVTQVPITEVALLFSVIFQLFTYVTGCLVFSIFTSFLLML